MILGWLAILATFGLLPLFAYLAIVTFSAVLGAPARVRPAPRPIVQPRFLFVIPAHNEEDTIGFTVASCRGVDYPADRFDSVVIADNCTDATARVARAAGAIVVERTDPSKRSKGDALEYCFSRLAAVMPGHDADAVVVIDADSTVDPWILNAFASALADGKDWIQCYDTVRNPDVSWRTRMMTYAFSLINGVWLVGQERLGLGASLKGNGMCLSLRGLRRVPWRASGLAEDAEFSWRLRLAGETVAFLPGARVHAEMLARGGSPAAGQRRRWESGRRIVRDRFLGPLLRSGRLGAWRKLAHLVELVFPSLVVLAVGLAVVSAVHFGAFFNPSLQPASRLLAPVHSAMALILASYALSPFYVMSLPLRFLTCLVQVPYYAVWKILIALGKRPTAWIRTRREVGRPMSASS